MRSRTAKQLKKLSFKKTDRFGIKVSKIGITILDSLVCYYNLHKIRTRSWHYPQMHQNISGGLAKCVDPCQGLVSLK